MPLHTATEMCSRLWQLALVRVNLRSLLLVILICCLVNYIYVHEAITETWPPSEYDASQKTTKPTEHRDAPPLPPSVHAVTEKHRFRQLNVKDFPYRCGIVLFYHIPCTGGSSINKWFDFRVAPANNFSYFTHWGRRVDARDSFARMMEEQLEIPLHQDEWRVSHAHGFSLLPIEDETNLYKWRAAVENQGCKFIVTTVVRDALSHTISQLKSRQWSEIQAIEKGEKLNIPMIEWLAQLGTNNRTAPRLWSSQLDYLLFNSWDKNMQLNKTMSREDKVRRGIEILRNHFDLVIYQNHDLFVKIITKMIGFAPIPLRSSNQHMLEINFTEQQLDLLKQRIYENGDVDWINMIRHVYDGHLQYLAR